MPSFSIRLHALVAALAAAGFLCTPREASCAPPESGESAAGEEAGELAADEEIDPFFTEIWKSLRPGYKAPCDDCDPMLFKPLVSGSNNFFHHLLLIPPMEGFELLCPGTARMSMGVGHSYCTDAEERPGNRYKAAFTEMRVDIGYGLTSIVEMRAGFNLASLSFDDARDARATQDGVEVFPPERFNPSLGLGDVLLGLKLEAIRSDKYDTGVSAVMTLKIPVGKSDFLTSGRGDFAMALVGTWKLKFKAGILVFFHLNAGWAWFDEENVFRSKVYVNSASFYGLSIVAGPSRADGEAPDAFNWAVILQCQGHENAFAKMDQFNSTPATVHGGLRGSFGGWIAEFGAGFGVTKHGSADYVIDAAVSRAF